MFSNAIIYESSRKAIDELLKRMAVTYAEDLCKRAREANIKYRLFCEKQEKENAAQER